jgi:hypothetical protein
MKKITHWLTSPVGLIVGTIIATVASTLILDLIKSQRVLTSIIWLFNYEIKLWIVLIILLIVIIWLSKWTKNKINSSIDKPHAELKWLKYTEDKIRGNHWRWEWEWSKESNLYSISDLRLLCDNLLEDGKPCLTPKLYRRDHDFYNGEETKRMECPRCYHTNFLDENFADECILVETIITDDIRRGNHSKK